MEHTEPLRPSPPHLSGYNTRSALFEAQLDDIHRFLSNPAEVLQHLLALLSGITPPLSGNHNSNTSFLPLIPRPSSLYDLHSPPSRVQGSSSQP